LQLCMTALQRFSLGRTCRCVPFSSNSAEARPPNTHQRATQPKGCHRGVGRQGVQAQAGAADASAAFPDDDLALQAPATPSQPASSQQSAGNKVVAFQKAFWKFLRPHTIRGTILGSTAVTARALIESPVVLDWALLPRAALGVLALLCGNGYIVGINQIYDVDIDAVNKPFLPVAAGELSPGVAWALVAGLAALGISVCARNFGPTITKLYSLGLFLGTIYSVPPLRLKRFAVPAFLIIATVRGFLLNFGVYSATRAALGLEFQWSPAILFITSFVTVFATVIAITKDLPDVEGDLKYNIKTLATQLGVRGVAFLGSGLLLGNYAAAILMALKLPWAFRVPLMVGAHALLAIGVVYATLQLEAAKYSQKAIQAYYQFIWNVFYAEYCLLPFL